LAVSVALPDPAKVGQFLVVGSRITVFDTFNVQEADTKDITPAGDHIQGKHENTRATRVLLPDVEVLAVGQTTTTPAAAGPQDAKVQNASAETTQEQAATALVTVAVTQAEAEKLIHGIQTGTLYLGLHGTDTSVKITKGVDDRSLFQEVAP
jgi:pilus assembly protein CpaB